MNLPRIYFIVILSLLFSSFSAGQTIDEESNWYKEIGKYDDVYSRFDFTRYSKQDVVNAKNRYLRIEAGAKDEWEGVYVTGTETVEALLTWNAGEGYVFTYVYHWLSSLDHGTVTSGHDYLRFASKSTYSKKRWCDLGSSEPFFKVRIGRNHYLVPGSGMKEFGERVGGRETSDEFMRCYFFRKDESEVKTEGAPVFPKAFAHLISKPIVTKLVRIGPRRIHQDKFDDGTVNYEEIHQYVVIAAGTNKSVRKGMDFFVESLGEWVEVTRVSGTTSIARLRRGLGENRRDKCFDSEGGNGDVIPCKLLQIGARAETKPDDFL